jgi:spermidine/putrescine transport system permease protein
LKGKLRVFYDSLVYISVMIPGIVIGIATLIALVTLFGFLNPLLANIWPSSLGKPPVLNLGYVSLIGAHTLFTMSLSILIVRSRLNGMDRNLIEASNDLYGTPVKTFLKITLPQLFPAILSAFLLSFTFSFDDFIIAFFVAGSETTLPVYVFSSIRRGVTPEINAIATLILTFTILLLLVSHLLMKYKNYNNKSAKK